MNQLKEVAMAVLLKMSKFFLKGFTKPKPKIKVNLTTPEGERRSFKANLDSIKAPKGATHADLVVDEYPYDGSILIRVPVRTIANLLKKEELTESTGNFRVFCHLDGAQTHVNGTALIYK